MAIRRHVRTHTVPRRVGGLTVGSHGSSSVMAPHAPIKIMPFGDSITVGGTAGQSGPTLVGYRQVLWNLLRAQGWNIDFVGALSHGPSDFGDREHEGLGGFAISQLIPLATALIATYQPKVILLLAGTNDIGGGASGATTASRLATILETIHLADPDIWTVYAAQPHWDVIQTGEEGRRLDALALIPGVILSRQTAGQRVSWFDTGGTVVGGDDTSVETSDAVGHPTPAGYADLAGRWYTALVPSVMTLMLEAA